MIVTINIDVVIEHEDLMDDITSNYVDTIPRTADYQ